MEQEPVRNTTILVGVVVGLLSGVVAWAGGADLRPAVGIAAANIGAFLATGQYLRGKVASPATYDKLLRQLDRGASAARGQKSGRQR